MTSEAPAGAWLFRYRSFLPVPLALILLLVRAGETDGGALIASPWSAEMLSAFGTGTGGVQPLEAGVQMRLAYEHFCRPPQHINPTMAQGRQDRVHYGGRWGFQNPRKVE